jgi:DNA mismatch endonuclease (patch repair protein)
MDTLSPAARSERMARIKGKNTGPEIVVRRLAHALGYRHRLHASKLPGRPDLVFPGRRKVVFIHGCFWHRHQARSCKLARLPKSKLDFWGPKLEGNAKRDEKVRRRLRGLGWQSLVIWECQVKNKTALERKIRRFLGA